jgi:hypothetical protein
MYMVISTDAGGRMEGTRAGTQNFPSESDEQKTKHFDVGMG